MTAAESRDKVEVIACEVISTFETRRAKSLIQASRSLVAEVELSRENVLVEKAIRAK